jgi:hypothetical protein
MGTELVIMEVPAGDPARPPRGWLAVADADRAFALLATGTCDAADAGS